jgi:hypothetical protein
MPSGRRLSVLTAIITLVVFVSPSTGGPTREAEIVLGNLICSVRADGKDEMIRVHKATCSYQSARSGVRELYSGWLRTLGHHTASRSVIVWAVRGSRTDADAGFLEQVYTPGRDYKHSPLSLFGNMNDIMLRRMTQPQRSAAPLVVYLELKLLAAQA